MIIAFSPSTTGIYLFAECQKYSAKGQKNSAILLPSVVLGKAHSVYPFPANRNLPRAFRRTLGKVFAEWQTRVLGKEKQLDGSKQRRSRHSAKGQGFAECMHSVKLFS